MHTTSQPTAPVLAASGNFNNAPKANMNVAEAASYIGIGTRTLRELIARREVRTVRIGSRVILRKADVDAYLESKAI